MTIYVLRYNGLVKIGFSSQLAQRVKNIMQGIPSEVEFVGHMPGDVDVERHLHMTFEAQRFSGKWFQETPEVRSFFDLLLLKEFPQEAPRVFGHRRQAADAETETAQYTANQATAAGYADRMYEADRILSEPSLQAAQLDVGQAAKGAVPLVGNMLTSSEFQQADQAQRNFINAILRRESGAAIATSEFDSAKKQYFPQPGDSAEVLTQKKFNRANAINGVARSAGPAYQARLRAYALRRWPELSHTARRAKLVEELGWLPSRVKSFYYGEGRVVLRSTEGAELDALVAPELADPTPPINPAHPAQRKD